MRRRLDSARHESQRLRARQGLDPDAETARNSARHGFQRSRARLFEQRSCGDGSTPQDMYFNDCVHDYLSKGLDPDAETARLRKTWISTIACTSI